MNTPISNGDKKIISKEFQLSVNNEQYLAKLVLSNKITISLIKTDLISSVFYNTNLTLDDLGKLNKIFKLYETVEEAYKILEQLFLREKVTLNNVEDKFSFEFKMNSPIGEEIIINIPLKIENIDKNEINERLYSEVNEHKNRIKFLEKENENFKIIIKSLESRLLKLEIKNIIDTNIINKKEEIDFFENMINNKFPNKNCKFNLIYRATRDGEVEKFHSRCDNKTQVIVLYQTNKDIKFGGYTYIGFDSSSAWKKDLSSFIFQINIQKVYNSKGDQHIGCYSCIGPSFGGHNPRGVAIYLFDNLPIFYSQKKGHKTNRNITTFEGLKDFEITNGDEFFILKELEVFQIIFD